MAWYIKGEAGKTLDATQRTLASMNVRNASLTFRSMGVDVLRWRASMADYTGGGTIIPDIGQKVELYYNTIRKFYGHCTVSKITGNDIQIEISGPWWWMQNTPLTSLRRDGVGTNAERVQFVFPTQNLAASIKGLLDRTIALGCPLRVGNITPMYNCPRITLSQMDCASALSELLRWCPDAVTAFQYSTGLPTLHVTRRAAATVRTFNLATSNLEHIDINPRLDLKVDRVELKHVQRDSTTGKPKWAQQADGTGGSGKRQIITISGPEIADFLPGDDFDSYWIKTQSSASTFALWTESGVVAYRKKNGNANLAVGNNNSVSLYVSKPPTGIGDYPRQVAVSFDAPKFIRTNGNPVDLKGRYLITTDTPPDWVKKTPGIKMVEGTLSGTFYRSYAVQLSADDPVYSWNKDNSDELRNYVSALGLTEVLTGWDGNYRYRVYSRPFSIPAKIVSIDYSAGATLRKPWEYNYLSPPANLASNLRSAQNWLPWEGRITVVSDEVTAANWVNNVFNVTSALPATSNMKALAREVTHEIERGRTHITLGAPPRHDLGGLVSRVRRDPQDNIVYL